MSSNKWKDLAGRATRVTFPVFKIDILNNTNKEIDNCSVGLGIFTLTDNMLLAFKSEALDVFYNLKPGLNTLYCEINRFPLSGGMYKFNVILNKSAEILDWVKDVGVFEVENSNFFNTGKIPAFGSSIVLIDHNWKK